MSAHLRPLGEAQLAGGYGYTTGKRTCGGGSPSAVGKFSSQPSGPGSAAALVHCAQRAGEERRGGERGEAKGEEKEKLRVWFGKTKSTPGEEGRWGLSENELEALTSALA